MASMTLQSSKRLALIGGGHAHLFVLEHLAHHPRPDLDIVFVTPSRFQMYSGMLPGWMSGSYRLEDCRIDLKLLAARAGVRLVEMAITHIDAMRQCVALSDGRTLGYDLASLDTGSETDLRWLADLEAKLLPVKPIADFQGAWPELLKSAVENGPFTIAIVGGGAAGVEIALNARRAFAPHRANVAMTLIAGESGLLPGHSSTARRCASRWLEEADVEVIFERAVGVKDGVLLSSGHLRRADRVIAATGPRAPAWLAVSNLQLDEHGYVRTDAFNRSLSHANVFAAGDICARDNSAVPRSGVHAVRAGPILAHNLLATVCGQSLRQFRPRRRVLHILADGDRRAVLSFGPLGLSGRWVRSWKDKIDRRFIARFSPNSVKS